MVMVAKNSAVTATPPVPRPLTQEKFDRGVISIVGPANLPLNALVKADNLVLDEDGRPTLRPGNDWYGTALPTVSDLDGGAVYVDSNEVPHLIAVTGGIVYRSLDDGQSWQQCTGGSFTTGYKIHTLQTEGALRMFNGHDYELRYVGEIEMQSYSELFEPVHPYLTKTGLAGTTTVTYTYYLSAVNEAGYTALSSINLTGGTNAVAADRDRGSFDDSNYASLAWNKGLFDTNGDGFIDVIDESNILTYYHTGKYQFPVRYDLYVSTNGAPAQYFDSVDVSGLDEFALITYVDKGQSPAFSTIIGPTQNTTRGLRVANMEQIGTRIVATADYDNPWRISFSGEGVDIGKFSNAFGATYIDLQEGSQYRPVVVKEYHNGKGDAVTTLWRRSADGTGDVWQGTLDTFTVGTSSFVVPNFNKLPGSRGTTAADSVVNVLNDYMYYNSQAIYNLGTRAAFLNLLSTDEATANIRKDVRSITPDGSEGICTDFFEAKVYFSVNFNSSINNRIIIYDTERHAWLPKAFDFGVERFFHYTDTTGTQHQLCWKPGDNRFTEISRSIKGSYGQAFPTELLTGLVHANAKNRMDFMWVEEAEFELSDVNGEVTTELDGLTREDGFGTIDSRTVSQGTDPMGWTRGAWTKHVWTHGSKTALVNYSEPTMKRYFNIQQDINNYQWRITTNSLEANYLLRMLQVPGTASDAGKPRDWELL
jgi:hypothetical protein